MLAESSNLYVLQHGNKKARGQIAAAKVYAPNVVLRVIDAAVQVRTHTLAVRKHYCRIAHNPAETPICMTCLTVQWLNVSAGPCMG